MSVPVKIYRSVVYQDGQTPSNPNLNGDPVINPVNPDGGPTDELVPYDGAIRDVNLGEKGLTSGYVTFDTTTTSTPTDQGTMYWDATNETVALIMDGVTQHIGQDFYIYVKNSTGATIPKGKNVGFAGTDGASGHVLIKKFIANGTEPSEYFIGVTAEAIDNGSFGQVLAIGELTGINTLSYSPNPLLYCSTTVAGEFQTTVPVAPNNIILVAAAVNFKNNGDLKVRPTIGSNINRDEGVKITSPTNGQALLYNSSTQLWENATISGQVPVRQVFAYTSSNTFTLSYSNPTAIYVALNGQVLEQGGLYDWTISGTTLTVTTPLLSGDEISILYYTNLPNVTNYGRNIDGGAPDSVYLPIQNVDGGTP